MHIKNAESAIAMETGKSLILMGYSNRFLKMTLELFPGALVEFLSRQNWKERVFQRERRDQRKYSCMEIVYVSWRD